ncbi:hypothetical protein LWE61_14100 [Sphingobium sufflavum]|uniref:hypothetical protein n=1 Tax=Sphingobium sufflavum TaxID=1129547 RepID=UPI001F206252|nr:hypothetical protein [Sphingobium sufflavum]MCE7797680.1 hypothetical protein [Sphingobium sufflavum]
MPNRPSPVPMALWLGVAASLLLPAAPAVARDPGGARTAAAKRAAARLVEQYRKARLHSEWSGPVDAHAHREAPPADGTATLVAASGTARPGTCWDCAYTVKPVRQFRPGDMTFTFRPVGGTLNYHF